MFNPYLKGIPVLKWLAIVAVVYAAVGIASIANAKPQSTPEQRIAKHGSSTSTEETERPQDDKGTTNNVMMVGEQEAAPGHQSDTGKDDEYISVQRKLANLTALLVIVGLLQAAILAITICAIVHQTKTNRDTNRVWVLATVIGQPEEPLTGNAIKGTYPGIVWQIQIAGNTPAQIISEQYRCRVVPSESGWPTKPILEPIPTYLPNSNLIEGTMAFPPGFKYVISSSVELDGDIVRNLTRLKVNKSEDGKTALCAYGRIEYKDVFQKIRVSQFCAVYRPRNGGVIKSPDGTDLNAPGFRMGGPAAYNKYS